jgi:hypothetical protein
VMIALRTIAPQDLKAMNAWIDVHGTDDERAMLMRSLPSLPIGDAWFWSPGWPAADGIFQRVHVLPIETFDSGATPKPGEKRIEPKQLADVDLEALRRQMSETIERAKADNPKELKKQIADLKKQLAAKPTPAAAPAIDRALEKERALFKQELDRLGKAVAARDVKIAKQATAIRDALDTILSLTGIDLGAVAHQIVARTPAPAKVARRAERPWGQPVAAKTVSAPRTAPADGDEKMPIGERKILTVLAQHPDGCRANKLALLSERAYNGTMRNLLASLRTKGLIEGANTETMRITDAGAAALGDFERLPSNGEELAEYWINQFGMQEGKLLRALINHPDGLTAIDLADAAGYQYNGTMRNALAKLRTAGVISGKNTSVMKASEEFQA